MEMLTISREYRKALALNRDKCRRYLAVVFAGPMRRLKERQRKREEEERKREEEERKVQYLQLRC